MFAMLVHYIPRELVFVLKCVIKTIQYLPLCLKIIECVDELKPKVVLSTPSKAIFNMISKQPCKLSLAVETKHHTVDLTLTVCAEPIINYLVLYL